MIIKPQTIINGITYFTPPPPIVDESGNMDSVIGSEHFPKEGMDMLYLAENKHFWHISRREFIYQEVSKYLSIDAKILDVGAGTGSVTRYFLENGYNDISLGEIHPNGLEYAKSYGIKKLYCMDLLDAPFIDEFDCIFAFDVLEHIDDDLNALKNIKRMLKNSPNSFVAISVPAHQWLWNAHDVLVHHKRRYTKRKLINIINQSGLKVEFTCYFFISITPLLYLRAIFNSAKKVKHEEILRDVPPPHIINQTLLAICRLENKLCKYIPNLFGGSLFMLARNNA